MPPHSYMEQSENGEETTKAFNLADLQTENRPEESNFWLRKSILTILFTVLLIFAVAIIVLAVVISRPSLNQAAAPCPVRWIGSQGRTYPWKCYYFSEAEGDWNATQSNCSSLGAILATVDTLEEKEFMLRYQRRSETWIGLTREADEPWKWVNGTLFNNLFQIRGRGECAYLNGNRVISSSRCSTPRHWVCSRPG